MTRRKIGHSKYSAKITAASTYCHFFVAAKMASGAMRKPIFELKSPWSGGVPPPRHNLRLNDLGHLPSSLAACGCRGPLHRQQHSYLTLRFSAKLELDVLAVH